MTAAAAESQAVPAAAMVEVGVVGGAVAAGELVLAGGDEGEVGVVGAAGDGRVVVEHEVADGFAGELPPLEEDVEVKDVLALQESFPQREEECPQQVPGFLGSLIRRALLHVHFLFLLSLQGREGVFGERGGGGGTREEDWRLQG